MYTLIIKSLNLYEVYSNFNCIRYLNIKKHKSKINIFRSKIFELFHILKTVKLRIVRFHKT